MQQVPLDKCSCSGDDGIAEVSADERRHEDNHEQDQRSSAVHATELWHCDVLLVNNAYLSGAEPDQDTVAVGARLDNLVRVGILVAGVGLSQQVGEGRLLVAGNLPKVCVARPLPLDDVADLRSWLPGGPLDQHILLADDLGTDQRVRCLVGPFPSQDLRATFRVHDAILLQLPPSILFKLRFVDRLPGHDQIVCLDIPTNVVALPLRLDLLLQSDLVLLRRKLDVLFHLEKLEEASVPLLSLGLAHSQ
mmetsp:Transcript_71405/g.209294  ORF Transcript_71405/g.209294 Transcript_71405/m.209294 type:complete len:249 (-) Transcript_71405:233-979(-)